MDIGFLWDERKYQAVVKKHRVHFYEVVSAFDDPKGYEVPDPAAHADRWVWVGRAVTNRVLVVVYSEEALPVYRLNTAFEAEGSWLDEYTRE